MGASGTRLDEVYHMCNVIAGVPRGHFRTMKRLEQNKTRLGSETRGEERKDERGMGEEGGKKERPNSLDVSAT